MLRKRLGILFGIIASLLVGVTACSAAPASQSVDAVNVPKQASSETKTNQTIWIKYARYTAYQASVNPEYWLLTETKVASVGQFIGSIDDPKTESGWHSNDLAVGTDLYEIANVPFSKALAVHMKDGIYLIAVFIGGSPPAKKTVYSHPTD